MSDQACDPLTSDGPTERLDAAVHTAPQQPERSSVLSPLRRGRADYLTSHTESSDTPDAPNGPRMNGSVVGRSDALDRDHGRALPRCSTGRSQATGAPRPS